MDAATINAKIYAGRAKTALRIGFDFTVYRPTGAANPLATQVGTLKAAFNAGDNTYRKPNLYGHPIWFADLDGRLVQPGDYLVQAADPTNIYFIAGMQSLLPIVAIDCPRTVRITASVPESAVGFVGYAGVCADDAEYLAGDASHAWPCSITLGKGTEANKSPLPSSSSKQIGWQILLPPSLPVTIRAGARFIDDLGKIYIAAGGELSDLGWRVTATEVHA